MEIQDVLRIYIDQQRRIFNELADRLRSFAPQQEDSQAGRAIYTAWHESYTEGAKALQRFEAIAANIKAGELETATRALGVPPGALATGNKGNDACLLYHILLNEGAPASIFWTTLQKRNRALIPALLAIGRQSNEPELCSAFDSLMSLVISFGHPEDGIHTKSAATDDPGFWQSTLGTIIKILGGFAAGRITAGAPLLPSLAPAEYDDDDDDDEDEDDEA